MSAKVVMVVTVVASSEHRSSDGSYYIYNILQKLSTTVVLSIIEPGHKNVPHPMQALKYCVCIELNILGSRFGLFAVIHFRCQIFELLHKHINKETICYFFSN